MGLTNGAIAANIGINNAPYQKTALNDAKKRGVIGYTSGGPMVMFGIDYEFGFKRSKSANTQAKRKKRNRAIIKKYETKL